MSLLDALRVSHVVSVDKDPMLLVTEQEHWDQRMRMVDFVPFSIALIDLKRPQLAEQLAAMGCAQIMGPGGSIAVVGDTLVVRDRGETVWKVRSTVQALDAQPGDVERVSDPPAAR